MDEQDGPPEAKSEGRGRQSKDASGEGEDLPRQHDGAAQEDEHQCERGEEAEVRAEVFPILSEGIGRAARTEAGDQHAAAQQSGARARGQGHPDGASEAHQQDQARLDRLEGVQGAATLEHSSGETAEVDHDQGQRQDHGVVGRHTPIAIGWAPRPGDEDCEHQDSEIRRQGSGPTKRMPLPAVGQPEGSCAEGKEEGREPFDGLGGGHQAEGRAQGGKGGDPDHGLQGAGPGHPDLEASRHQEEGRGPRGLEGSEGGGGFPQQGVGDQDRGQGVEGGMERGGRAPGHEDPGEGVDEPQGHAGPVGNRPRIGEGADEEGAAEDQAHAADHPQDGRQAGRVFLGLVRGLDGLRRRQAGGEGGSTVAFQAMDPVLQPGQGPGQLVDPSLQIPWGRRGRSRGGRIAKRRDHGSGLPEGVYGCRGGMMAFMADPPSGIVKQNYSFQWRYTSDNDVFRRVP